VWLRNLPRSGLGFGCFEIKLVQSSQDIKIESMKIGTSSDVTLQSQSIEMVEDRMLVCMVVGSERRLVV
jgi:hypothetical protein